MKTKDYDGSYASVAPSNPVLNGTLVIANDDTKYLYIFKDGSTQDVKAKTHGIHIKFELCVNKERYEFRGDFKHRRKKRYDGFVRMILGPADPKGEASHGEKKERNGGEVHVNPGPTDPTWTAST